MADLTQLQPEGVGQAPMTAAPTQTSPSSTDPTQSVLNTIQQARQSGKGVKIDFSALHPDADTRQIVSALMDGLPQGDASKVNAAAMGGHGVAVDYRQYPDLNSPEPPVQSGGIYEDQPKTRFIANRIVRPAVEVAGQAMGGMLGAALGTPEAPGIGTTALGLAGATAGGTLADEAMNKEDIALGLQHPEDQPGGQPTGQRLEREGLNNALMVGTGDVVGGAAKTLSPLADEVNVPAREAFQRQGVQSTAANESFSPALQQLEGLVSKLPFVGGSLREYVGKTYDQMMGVAQSIMGKQMSPSIAQTIGDNVATQTSKKINDLAQSNITPQLEPSSVGNSIASDISDFTKNKMDDFSRQFNDLKQSAPNTPIQVPSAIDQAAKVAENVKGIPPAMRNPQLGSILKLLGSSTEEVPPAVTPPIATIPSGEYTQATSNYLNNPDPQIQTALKNAGVVSPIPEPPKPPSFTVPQLMEMRSAVGNAAALHNAAFGTQQTGTKFMGDKISGGLQSLIGAIDDDISAGTEGTPFSDQYAQLRSQYGAMKNTMANPYIRGIISSRTPENIVNQAVQKGDISNIATLQSMISPQTKDQLGNAFTNSLIDKATNADGQFMPEKLNGLISTYGEPTISQAIGPRGLNNLKQLANLSDGSFQDPNFRNFITSLGKKNGQNVTSLILGQRGPQGVANVARMRSLIGEDSWDDAQDGIVNDLLTNNQNNVDFGGLGHRLQNADPAVLSASLDPEKINTLNDLATMGSAIKRSNPSALNPAQTGYMMGAFWLLRSAFSNPLAALKVLAGIGAASTAYTTPLAKKWLTDGLVSEGVPEGAQAATSGLTGAIFGNSILNPYKKVQKP